MRNTIILIIVAFVGTLAVSVGILLFMSPDFQGFGAESHRDSIITYLTDEPGVPAGNGDTTYNWKDHPVFIVGDSLTQGARSDIQKTIGDATIDAKVSRNMAAGVSILKDWEATGIITDDAIIVVCLAHNITNTTIKDAQEVVAMIKPGQSLIMMTGHGLSDMEPVNEYLRGLPEVYSYITVADWDMTVAQSPALLADDGIHISKRQGQELYATLIERALEVSRPMQ